jgi:hypothetical protein
MTDNDTCHNARMLIVASRPRRLKQPTRFARLTPPQDIVPPAFRLTSRILSILSWLATDRFLSTDQIARLDGGSPRGIERILRLLHRHGFVDRPAAQAAYLSSFLHDGNVSLAHNITRKGMRLLADNGVPVDPRLDWTTKNSGNTALFLAHALEVSETMLAFRMAMPADQSLRLIDHNELLPSFAEAPRESEFPYRLVVTIQQDNKPFTIRVIPDRLFCICTEGNRRWNFALEIDRGTENLTHRSKKLTAKTTFAKRTTGYYHAWKQGKHDESWNFKGFRCLTITTSDARIDHMLDVQQAITNDYAAGLFLYSTRERIEEHGVLGPAWRSSKEDGIRLVRT